MTPPAQPHPQRCETCDFFKLYEPERSEFAYCNHPDFIHDSYINEIHGFEYDRIEKMGCASHSSRPAPQPDAPNQCYHTGYSDGAQKERENVIEILCDLNKYSCFEYEEANLSDNEREMRIHLEYGNRLWGIIRSLRSTPTAQERDAP